VLSINPGEFIVRYVVGISVYHPGTAGPHAYDSKLYIVPISHHAFLKNELIA